MAQDNSIPLLAFQGESPVDNFLSSYSKSQQQAQGNELHQRKIGMLDQQTEQAKLEMVADALVNVADGDAAGFERVKQGLVARKIIDPQTAAQYDVSALPQIKAASEKWRAAQKFTFDQNMAERKFSLDERQTNAQIEASRANAAQSYAQADAAKRIGQGGAAGRPMGRPMSAGVQSKEDEDISDIQSVQSINTQIDQILTKLDPKKGDLALGPINNLISQGQNLAGLSTPGSRDYAVLEATLEKMRNDSLRLNKGVQTEGDAIRAWNEITKYMTDPAVVREQLQRISVLNAQAAQQRLQRINIRRSRNGYDAFNPAEIGYGGGVQAQAAPPPSEQLGGPEPGTVEDGYVFRGGDPRDPSNWSEVQ